MYGTKILGNAADRNQQSLNHSVYKATQAAAIKAKKHVPEKKKAK